MTVQVVNGDIFEDDAEILVNANNCLGISGGGIALPFKQKFPIAQKKYEKRCKEGKLKLGTVMIAKDVDRQICYFPTMYNPGEKADIRNVYEGLIALRQFLVNNDISSVAMPALGVGIGGLPFDRVRECVLYCFREWPDIDVRLYEPR